MTGSGVTIFFDVNETLSDLSSVATAFEEVGADSSLASTWFATILRDGFAMTIADRSPTFAVIAEANARSALRGTVPDSELDDAVGTVMDAFRGVSLHPDVAPAVIGLRRVGHQLFTLSNGATTVAEKMFDDADIRSSFNDVLTVEGQTPWKPHVAAYLGALDRTGTDEGDAWLVAVHPWDIDGAAAAGLSTVWIDRAGADYPSHFRAPTITISDLGELAGRLATVS